MSQSLAMVTLVNQLENICTMLRTYINSTHWPKQSESPEEGHLNRR